MLIVYSPESVIDWFVDFYDKIKDSPVKPVECITKPGELLFIPSRWWHTALNLEESIAVTQNVVDRQNLGPVIEFLKSKKKQELFQAFHTAVEESYPGLMQQAETEYTEKTKPKQSQWQQLTAQNDSSFSFGFSFSISESIEEEQEESSQ